MKEFSLLVAGLSGGGGAAAVEYALRGVEGVVDVQVKLDSSRVIVLTIDELEAHDLVVAIRSAGYTVEEA